MIENRLDISLCLVYARVSSKEQDAEGFSIPAQLKLLHQYSRQNDFKIVKEFTDIETAKKSGRTEFTKMLTYLEENPDVRTILVEKTDRLYRNFKDYVILEDYNLSIHLVKEGQVISKDSRSHEKFIHGIKVLMAKNYIDNLSEEVKKGLKEKVAQGGYPGSAPFGYLNNKDEKTIEPDGDLSAVVKQLFDWYATGDYSLKTLRRKAMKEGLLANVHKYRSGVSTIHKVLRNPVYCGKIRFKGELFEGTHFPLVDEKKFQLVQDILNGHAQTKSRVDRQFTYMGMFHCSECGCAITAEIKKGKYVYYHCTKGKSHCANSKNYIREEVIDRQIKGLLQSIRLDSNRLEWVTDALKSSHIDEKAFHQKMIQSIQIKIDELQSKIDKAYEDKLDGKIPEEFWITKFRQWENQKANLIVESNAHQKANKSYYESGVKLLELSSRAHELYEKQSVKEKQKLLKFVLSNSKMLGDAIQFELKMPFNMIMETKKSENWLGQVRALRTEWPSEIRIFRELFLKVDGNLHLLKIA